MYKLLLVDDEPLIRKGLLKIIDWKSMNCEVTHVACNGADALTLLKTEHIDIVLSDIKMPGVSGIDLAKYIYENCPNTKIILLTGYSDFEYAQSAIKYNVVDFLLKPTSTEKIVSSILKAQDLLIKNVSKDSQIKNLEEKMMLNYEKLKITVLNEILNNIIDETDINLKLKEAEINLSNYYVLISEFKSSLNINDLNICTDINAIIDIFPLIFGDATIYNIILKNNKLCTIINYDTSPKSISIYDLCNEVAMILKNFRTCNISIAISSLHNSPVELTTAFNEATKSISFNFYDFENDCIFYYPNLEFNNISTSDMNSLVNKIISLISSNDITNLIEEIKSMFTYFKDNKLNIDSIKHICVLISSKCADVLLKENISLTNLVENQNIFNDILNCTSITNLQELILGMIDLSFYALNHKPNEKNSIVDNAKKYIEQNFTNADLTLNEIATHVHVSNAYLSRLFKEKTGETISDLIIRTRIEKAKVLLKDNSLKIYEIAYSIGIDDPAYFSQLFKKYTKISPKEYKYKF